MKYLNAAIKYFTELDNKIASCKWGIAIASIWE
jgi:hypothetical protein